MAVANVLIFQSLFVLALAAVLVMRARRRLVALVLVYAIGTLGINDLAIALQYDASTLFSLEWLRSGAWLSVIYLILRDTNGHTDASQGRFVPLTVVAVGTLVPLSLLCLTLFGGLAFPAQYSVLVSLVVAVVGVVGVEQLYRNSIPQSRRIARYLSLSAGVIFVLDLFAYSQAQLLGGDVKLWWEERAFAHSLTVALALPVVNFIALRKSAQLFVSRHVVFYSVGAFAVGGYFLLLAIGGYALSVAGFEWTNAYGAVTFLAAIGMLAVVLFFWQWRRRVRVFIAKHFYRNRYDYREEWLGLMATLSDTGGEMAQLPERCLQALANIVDAPGGALWVRDQDGSIYSLKAKSGSLECAAGLATTHGLPVYLNESGWVIDSREYRVDPSQYDSAELELESVMLSEGLDYYIVPIVRAEKVFAICLLQQRPNSAPLDFESHDLLKTAGRQIAVHLAQEGAMTMLSEARQFEAFSKFGAFIMHDIKNLIAQLSLVLQNAAKHRDNPEFIDDAMNTIKNSVSRMERLVENFQRGGEQSAIENVKVVTFCQEAVNRLAGSKPEPELYGSAEEAATLRVAVNAERAATVVSHLLRNAQDATNRSGEVKVSYSRDGEMALIQIVDNGEGMSEEFIRDRLFKPFDSTKGAKGMGVGAFQARQFAVDFGGSLQVKSELGVGTQVNLRLPALPR